MRPFAGSLALMLGVITWACGGGSDESAQDGGALCSASSCMPPECGYVYPDGKELCIEKPDCTGLAESPCKSTLGCAALYGHKPTDPPDAYPWGTYVGCGDGTGTPGGIITCTAPGPEGPCWVLPETRIPTGWYGWSCGDDPVTDEECMAQAPF